VRSDARGIGVNGNTHLLTDNAQLLDGGGTLQVGGGEQRMMAFADEKFGEFAAGGGFAGTLEAAIIMTVGPGWTK
jgi:hypothetical protein